jgi:hypothetical protein
MAVAKIKMTFEINPDSYEMLKAIQEKYQIPDPSKVLRVLLDYAATDDADWDKIFGEVRCRRCG